MTGVAGGKSIAELGAALRDGSLTSVALTEETLDRIDRQDGQIDSFILVTRERALADAAKADKERASGVDKGPMHGIPYGLKDIYDTAGITTTCHSKLRLDNVPEADSVCAVKLREAGGVLIGKLATHEFAFGGPSFDLPFPPARNPWNRNHGPGGSSSGSGAAVAAGFLRMAMGSDTGGSIRGPAAYCGIIGMKPTYGRVSRRGVFPLSYTLDHCGPLSKNVEDAAITLQCIAGYDPLDPASANQPVPDYRADLGKGVAGLRVGILSSFYKGAEGLSDESAAAIEAAAATFRSLGAEVEEVAAVSPYADYNNCGRVILLAEAYAIHEQDLQTRPLDYGRLTMERIVLGGYLTAADLMQAQRQRRELCEEVNTGLFSRYDILLAPSSLSPAPLIDAPQKSFPVSWPMQTLPFNVTGNPAMSIPVGFSKSGLPLSMQIVGKYFDEATVFRAGQAYEQATEWHQQWPAMGAIADASAA
ncbi:amidase [uncultured Nisaea sp.]|uniref:amidase n=1 Tax=uncultured Nisaea sp. TaxID=538215 RepID=UPI0030EEF4C0|tara:strand:+ start:30601 stop:32028 length:1428 start_codon:yes stop_codon:yes gene_type:complete